MCATELRVEAESLAEFTCIRVDVETGRVENSLFRIRIMVVHEALDLIAVVRVHHPEHKTVVRTEGIVKAYLEYELVRIQPPLIVRAADHGYPVLWTIGAHLVKESELRGL